MSGLQNRDRVLGCRYVRRSSHRDGQGRYSAGSKVVVPCFRGPCFFDVVLHVRRVGRPAARRCPGGASQGDVDDEGIVYGLSTGEVSIERPRHWLLGPQHPFLLVPVGPDAEGEVWRIELAAERVGVLAQDHFPHVVYQVVLVYRDERGGGARPLDPDLAHDHVAADGEQLFVADAGVFVALGPAQQGLDEGGLPVGEEGLSSDGGSGSRANGGVAGERGARGDGALGAVRGVGRQVRGGGRNDGGGGEWDVEGPLGRGGS